jgi:hypothetical protein
MRMGEGSFARIGPPAWAVSNRREDVKRAVASVLFGMADSAMWRPHIPQDKWKLSGILQRAPRRVFVEVGV